MKMNMKLVKIGWRFDLLILIVLILIVTVIQFSLLKVVLQNGFTLEDRWILFAYKVLAPVSFLDKYLLSLRVNGLYHTSQIMYLGFLESLFKGNYQAYWIAGIFFKILATISLYPFILAVFKRRLLAFLTTFLYGISYSASGALYFILLGSDYVAIFFMNVFLLSYYYYFTTRRKFLLYTATVLLFLSFMSAPIRMYPLFALVFLIEVFVWIKSGKLLGFVDLLLRLTFLFLPYLIILLFFPGAMSGQLDGRPAVVFSFLSYGNYQLLLTPFAGLGYTFLTNNYWSLIFGNVTFDNFRSYLFFLLQGPIIIYSILAILLGFLITKKPLFFILGIIFINLVFEIVSYFLITNVRMEVGPNIKYLHDVSTYAIFFGFFVISVAFSSLLIWLRNHKPNILLLSLFIGPIFSSVFLWGIWFVKGEALNFTEGIHWYMVIASMGSSLLLASLMVLTFDKIRLRVNPYLKYILIGFLFLTILPLYLISAKEINTTFTYLLQTGYKASDQKQMKSKLLSYIKEPLDKNPALFYFETQEQIFYPISLLVGFEEEMHFRNWELVNGCVGLIYDKVRLEKSVAVKENVKGFSAASLCVDSFGAGWSEMFYKPENFYAFKLKDKDAIDIKQDVLNELGFK